MAVVEGVVPVLVAWTGAVQLPLPVRWPSLIPGVTAAQPGCCLWEGVVVGCGVLGGGVGGSGGFFVLCRALMHGSVVFGRSPLSSASLGLDTTLWP